MKITMEHEGRLVSVDEPELLMLPDVQEAIDGMLMLLGFQLRHGGEEEKVE